MVKSRLSIFRALPRLALATLTLLPATLKAETFNMPKFGHVDKTVSETIDFYDPMGTGQMTGSGASSYSTVVFTPANPGEAIQVTFSRIELKSDGANYPVSLSIWDGTYDDSSITYPSSYSNVPTDDFPEGNGTLLKRYASKVKNEVVSGQDVTYTSQAEDGTLSVTFQWKYANPSEGWVATVRSVTLTDQEIVSVTPDYSAVNTSPYGGMKNVTLGTLNVKTDGILNPFSATSVSFDLDDPSSAIENIRLIANGKEVSAQPTIAGNNHTYTLDTPLSSGDNLYTVLADISPAAPFFATASLTFTSFDTTAPNTPAIAPVTPTQLTVAAVVMMPADGSHVTAVIEEGKPVSFYDNGGPEANYPENSSGTVTFRPADGSQGKVMLDFSNIALFNTNPAKNDQLVVYDGTEADPDKVLVTLLKQTKALVRSTSADGALTVSFSTVTGVTKAGWEATASLFTPQPMTLAGTDVTVSSTETVGAGDTGCSLLRILVKTKDTEPAMALSGIGLDFNGTSPQWEGVKVYYTRNTETFDPDKALLLANTPVTGESMSVSFDSPATLLEGDNFLWVLADIKADAQTGSNVDALVKTLTLNGESVTVTPPAGETGREVYNILYPAVTHPVKTVYGSTAVAHKPYSSYYPGYEGSNKDQLATFIPATEGNICELDFSKLNLYYYDAPSWNPTGGVSPVFKVFAGTTAEGTPIYTHEKENNLEAGADNANIGIIRSTSPDGALTILFNAGTSSTGNCKDGKYGFLGEVREYLPRPMTATGAEAFHTGRTSVPVTAANDVAVIGLNVAAEGNLEPVSVDGISFGIKADPSIYTSYKLATSGKKASPDHATVIATTTEVTDGVVTFTPATMLAEGDNHYWLLADVRPDATPGSVIDASVTSLTVGGKSMSVTNADPEGEILTVNTYDPITGDKDQVVEVGEYPILINGVTSAYLSSEYTITAKPAIDGGKVTARFTEGSFNVNTSNQYITVIGGAEPFGVDANTIYPVSVTSAREDGALIIEYHSMTIAKPEGWKCELTCDARKPFAINDYANLQGGSGKGTAGSEPLLYGVRIDVTGDKDDITIESFDFDIPGAADIFSELRLYATGDGSEFLRNNLIATTDASSTSLVPGETYAISSAGSYHFWLQGVVRADAANASATTVRPVSIHYSANGETSQTDLSSLEPGSFKVVGGFHGRYTIGQSAGADYGNFADALADIATGIDGPVEFLVEPGIYDELVCLDHIPGASAANTITIAGTTGDPADVVIASNNWVEPPYSEDKLDHYYGVVTLRGTSDVTLSGITIRTTNIDFPSVVHLAEGASDVTIERCVISAPGSTTTYNNLTLVNSYVNMSATSLNNRLTIVESDLIGGYTGVKFGSATINQPESEGITIDHCSFANQGYQAIYLYLARDVEITGNLLTGTAGSADKNYCQMLDLDISGPANITRNILDYTKTGVYGMYFRRLAGSDDAPIVIANNIVDVNVGAKPGAGVQLYNSASKPYTGFLFAHNTVRTSGSDVVMPLIINVKGGTKVEGRIANNILQNRAGYYVIKEQYGPSGATYLHNVGHTDSSDFGYAYWGGAYDLEMTFNQWTLESGEAGGVNARVAFDDSDESHPLYPSSFADLKCGTPLPEVTTDYLGVARDINTPTAGAYEAYTSAIESIVSSDTEATADGRSLYATDRLTVEADGAVLRIFSLSGALMMQTPVDGPTDVDVSALPRGMYVFSLDDRALRLILR